MKSPIEAGADWDLAIAPLSNTSHFAEWNERSSVRTKPLKYEITSQDLSALGDRRWFVPNALSYLNHPAVLALGPAASQNLEGRFLVNFMEYTALLEHQVVNRSAEAIAHGRMPVPIAESAKLGALMLYTDEAYHSYFSALVAGQVAKHLNISLGERVSPRISKLQSLVSSVEAPDEPLAQFLVGFVVETVITKEFLKFSEGVLLGPVYRVLRDHLEDEWIHGRYFSSLFCHVWAQLGDRDRSLAARLLPEIILECFTIDHRWLELALSETGLASDDIAEIVDERRSRAATRLRAARGATATIHALKRAGFFRAKANADLFQDLGLLTQSQ
jgi:hypothetical protein